MKEMWLYRPANKKAAPHVIERAAFLAQSTLNPYYAYLLQYPP